MSDQSDQVGFCAGYIIGVAEGIRYGISVPLFLGGEMGTEEINRLSDSILSYCIPPEVENGQAVEIVFRYLQDNPQNRHNPARQLIHFALADAFPCPS